MLELVKKTFLALVSIGVSFALLEIGATFLLPQPQIIIDQTKAHATGHPADKISSYEIASHPEEGHVYRETPRGRRLNPNIHIQIQNHSLSKKTITLQTNSQGYRNPPLSKKTGKRFLFLGDSITFADYLPEDQTFVRLFERQAHQHHKNWEAVNAGVGGISLKNELAILIESGLALEPDAVVLCFYLNDYWPSPGIFASQLPFPFNKSRFLNIFWTSFRRVSMNSTSWGNSDVQMMAKEIDWQSWYHEFSRSVTTAKGDYRTSPQSFNHLILKNFNDWGGSWSPKAWITMAPHFNALKELSVKHNFEVFLVIFPVRFQLETTFIDDFPQQQFKAVASKLHAPVLDLLPVLREHSNGEGTPLFYDQCHHTEAGSAIISQSLYQFISDHYSNDRDD